MNRVPRELAMLGAVRLPERGLGSIAAQRVRHPLPPKWWEYAPVEGRRWQRRGRPVYPRVVRT